jgi:hypothetical protein
MNRRAGVIAVAFGLAASGLAADTEDLNPKVVKYAKSKVGKQCGDGECTGLAIEALKAAGAKGFRAFPDSPANGDYVWGEIVYTLEIKNGQVNEQLEKGQKVKPGDIAQFRDCQFVGRNAIGPYATSAPHHTAVVLSTQGRTLTILHQNHNGRRVVGQSRYNLADLKAGWVRIYRPVAAE